MRRVATRYCGKCLGLFCANSKRRSNATLPLVATLSLMDVGLSLQHCAAVGGIKSTIGLQALLLPCYADIRRKVYQYNLPRIMLPQARLKWVNLVKPNGEYCQTKWLILLNQIVNIVKPNGVFIAFFTCLSVDLNRIRRWLSNLLRSILLD